MDQQILVAYASKYGATAEIAEKIGETLTQAGLKVDVLPVKRVKSLEAYAAVVLGSAAYMFQWRSDAAAFLKANEQALSAKPVWLFSSGPTGNVDAMETMKDQLLPTGLKPVAERIHPRDIIYFRGKLDIQKLNFIEKQMLKMVKAEYGDFRDWERITDWAEGIAGALKD